MVSPQAISRHFSSVERKQKVIILKKLKEYIVPYDNNHSAKRNNRTIFTNREL